MWFIKIILFSTTQEVNPRTAVSLRWRSSPSLKTLRSATSHVTPSRSAGTWSHGTKNASLITSLIWTRRRTKTPTSLNIRSVPQEHDEGQQTPIESSLFFNIDFDNCTIFILEHNLYQTWKNINQLKGCVLEKYDDSPVRADLRFKFCLCVVALTLHRS